MLSPHPCCSCLLLSVSGSGVCWKVRTSVCPHACGMMSVSLLTWSQATHTHTLLNCFCKIICPHFSLYLLWELRGHHHLGIKKMETRGERRMHRDNSEELSREMFCRPMWETTGGHGKRVAGATDELCSWHLKIRGLWSQKCVCLLFLSFSPTVLIHNGHLPSVLYSCTLNKRHSKYKSPSSVKPTVRLPST